MSTLLTILNTFLSLSPQNQIRCSCCHIPPRHAFSLCLPILLITSHTPIVVAYALLAFHQPLSSQDYSLSQALAKCNTGEIWPIACFYKSKILVEHSHGYLLMHCLVLLSCCIGRVKLLRQRPRAHKAKIFTTWSNTEEACQLLFYTTVRAFSLKKYYFSSIRSAPLPRLKSSCHWVIHHLMKNSYFSVD